MAEIHALSLDSILRAVRGTVCPICIQRPPGSEALPNNMPRSCEGACPIFAHLPGLYRIAVHGGTAAPGALEAAVKERICMKCSLAPTAGENCAEFASRTCPLSRYAGDVVSILEALREWQHRPAAKHA